MLILINANIKIKSVENSIYIFMLPEYYYISLARKIVFLINIIFMEEYIKQILKDILNMIFVYKNVNNDKGYLYKYHIKNIIFSIFMILWLAFIGFEILEWIDRTFISREYDFK